MAALVALIAIAAWAVLLVGGIIWEMERSKR